MDSNYQKPRRDLRSSGEAFLDMLFRHRPRLSNPHRVLLWACALPMLLAAAFVWHQSGALAGAAANAAAILAGAFIYGWMTRETATAQ